MTTQSSVLKELPEPQPITPVRVKRVIRSKRVIKFDATQNAMREIKQKGFGILNERDKSGFCVLVVNKCYRFREVLAWMRGLQEPVAQVGEDGADQHPGEEAA